MSLRLFSVLHLINCATTGAYDGVIGPEDGCGTFPQEEYKDRLLRTQEAMRKNGLGALFITQEVHHTYLTGMMMEFWQSPTRPFFLVVPAEGQITAVVPNIIGINYARCIATVGKVRTWSSPNPEDDGISLLVEVMKDVLASQTGGPTAIGAELGPEAQLRMPTNDFMRLIPMMMPFGNFVDASQMMYKVRLLKSQAEIDIQTQLCHIQSDALKNIPSVVSVGMTEREACRLAAIELLKAGVDKVAYTSCRSGPAGYDDLVGAASSRKLREGDVLIIDTGSVKDGYMCDFNRNWYVGHEVPDWLAAVQEAVYQALEAGIKAAKVGANTADVFHAMSGLLPGPESAVGRAGHAVGLALTEWPSILPAKAGRNVTLEEGMVFSFEPSLGFGMAGQFLVHEEMVVVRPGGGLLISPRAERQMLLLTKGLDETVDV